MFIVPEKNFATSGFENGGISSDIPQFEPGNIQSRDAFRPIAREQRYLMGYKPKIYRQDWFVCMATHPVTDFVHCKDSL